MTAAPELQTHEEWLNEYTAELKRIEEMSLIAKSESGESTFEILDEGTHAAVCVWLVDVGPQEVEWQGEKKIQHKLRLRFEVPEERVSWTDRDGNDHEGPKVIWATLTNSLSERSKLRAWLESWRGRSFTEEELAGFDLRNILGKPCMISVVHRQNGGRTYANITNISKIMKGLDPQPESDLFAFDFDAHTPEEFNTLPEWLQKIVEDGQRVRKEIGGGKPAANDFTDDDVPF